MTVPALRIMALEITRTCALACRHCRGDSRPESYAEELRFGEIRAILDNTASFSRPILIITGGEPLIRSDVYDIAAYSSSLGFRTVLATCGHLLNDLTVRLLIDSGVSRISLSIDGATSSTHDLFRGVPGAFEATLRGIDSARRNGLEFQVNSTLTSINIDELGGLHDLAVSLGAAGFHPFLLVPMGRGHGIRDAALGAYEYETTLREIARMSERSPIEIKPTCSPHYVRVATQLRASGRSDLTHTGQRHHAMTRGCLGGQGFVFVSHRGIVQTCGFLECEAGDLRAENYDMKEIWENSPLFAQIRDVENYRGKCGRCEFNRVCGGCRARAYAHTGDYLGEEPNCTYQPKG